MNTIDIIRQPFQKGVFGILKVNWTVTLETPLTIHNGQKAAYKQQDQNTSKGRGMHKEFAWEKAEQRLGQKKSGWSEVADLNYAFSIEQDQVTAHYSIPASSIRGALRNAAVTAFTERDDWQCFNLPKKELSPDKAKAEEREQRIKRALKELSLDKAKAKEREQRIKRALKELHNQSSGWYDILSLFGLVFELEEQKQQPHIWAGRLRLTTSLESPSDSKIDGKQYHDGGPPDLKRHITVRNPLDRVTSAAKEGGLHFTLEMSEGEAFQIAFEILNPKYADLVLLEAWREDIEDGFLRFGALTSQGRGRVKIESEDYTLYLRTQHRLAAKLNDLDDLLFQGIWKGKEMTFKQLQEDFGTEL